MKASTDARSWASNPYTWAPSHDLLGAVHGKPIEHFMQIHHEAMQRILTGRRHASELGNFHRRDINKGRQSIPQPQ
jgi:hypothetical protein